MSGWRRRWWKFRKQYYIQGCIDHLGINPLLIINGLEAGNQHLYARPAKTRLQSLAEEIQADWDKLRRSGRRGEWDEIKYDISLDRQIYDHAVWAFRDLRLCVLRLPEVFGLTAEDLPLSWQDWVYPTWPKQFPAVA